MLLGAKVELFFLIILCTARLGCLLHKVLCKNLRPSLLCRFSKVLISIIYFSTRQQENTANMYTKLKKTQTNNKMASVLIILTHTS